MPWTSTGCNGPRIPNFWRLPGGAHALLGPRRARSAAAGSARASRRSSGSPVGRSCGRPGQYLSYARPPSIMDIRINEVVRGHQISQARAVATVDGDEILTVNAALGDRPHARTRASGRSGPTSPHPRTARRARSSTGTRARSWTASTCASPTPAASTSSTARPATAAARCGSGCPGVLEMSAASLAIVGDYVPFGISQSLGHRAGGNSLDNTLRVASRAQTDWILADIRVHAVAHGFGHGLVHLWAAGRHAARHREPVDDRPRSGARTRRPTRTPRLTGRRESPT